MPTLDTPVLDWGDDAGPARHARRRRVHPGPLAAAAFFVAMFATVLAVVLVNVVAG
jgi:hypothetical protein